MSFRGYHKVQIAIDAAKECKVGREWRNIQIMAVINLDFKSIIALSNTLCDIETECRVATNVFADIVVVYPQLGNLICPFEVDIE